MLTQGVFTDYYCDTRKNNLYIIKETPPRPPLLKRRTGGVYKFSHNLRSVSAIFRFPLDSTLSVCDNRTPGLSRFFPH